MRQKQTVSKHVHDLFLAHSAMPLMHVCLNHCAQNTPLWQSSKSIWKKKIMSKQQQKYLEEEGGNIEITTETSGRRRRGEQKSGKKKKLNITAWYLFQCLALGNATIEVLCRNMLVGWWTVHARCLHLGWKKKEEKTFEPISVQFNSILFIPQGAFQKIKNKKDIKNSFKGYFLFQSLWDSYIAQGQTLP